MQLEWWVIFSCLTCLNWRPWWANAWLQHFHVRQVTCWVTCQWSMTSPWCIWTLDSTLLSITKALFFQSSISCFVCNLYIFLLGKECKVQKLRPRQELNSQPSNLNSGALSTDLWGLSVLREFYLYLNFWVFCKLLLEMLVNFGLVLRYKMEKKLFDVTTCQC